MDIEETALHLAVVREMGNSLHLVDFLVQNMPTQALDRATLASSDSTGSGSNTALHLCALHDKAECMKLLLRSGADPTLRNAQDKTPLDIAQERGHHTCEELLRHALQRQKSHFDNVNIDWNLSHDEGSTDFSDDETIIEDRNGSITPEKKSRSRPPSYAGGESPVNPRSRSSTSDSLKSGSSPNSNYRQMPPPPPPKEKKPSTGVFRGRQSVHDEERIGRPSLINDDRVELVRQCIMENRRFTITELSSHFPQISRSLLHEIVTKHLLFKKVCARWVPRNLTPEHKMQCLGAALTFLQRYHDDSDEFLDRIVTGDETWISHFTPETKQQSMHWWHSGSPVRMKFKETLSVRKVMCMVFWDRKGILLIDFLPRGETVNADRVVLLHDNACPHTARRTAAVLTEFGWELFDHPPYSPDLAPSDFHVFLHLKKFLSSGSGSIKKRAAPLPPGSYNMYGTLPTSHSRTPSDPIVPNSHMGYHTLNHHKRSPSSDSSAVSSGAGRTGPATAIHLQSGVSVVNELLEAPEKEDIRVMGDGTYKMTGFKNSIRILLVMASNSFTAPGAKLVIPAGEPPSLKTTSTTFDKSNVGSSGSISGPGSIQRPRGPPPPTPSPMQGVRLSNGRSTESISSMSSDVESTSSLHNPVPPPRKCHQVVFRHFWSSLLAVA
ncbi:hypothetical protein ANN_01821 [Periplaneta americana]|uniref:Uncharacterized protein n=1 Tax=Periplaneta americana TaxID=6978 RepID=A0ABQ8TWD3_PERAM|nr:hypothetical protein ANN_01821 [Periplaneta americana]